MKKILPIAATGIITATTVLYNVAPIASADKTDAVSGVEVSTNNEKEKVETKVNGEPHTLGTDNSVDMGKTAVANPKETMDASKSDTPVVGIEQEVKNIIVEGNTTLKESDVLKLVSNTKIGHLYSKDDVKKDLEAIVDAGIVQSAKARVVQNNGELYVVFEVEELSEIKSIQIAGNTLVDTEEITNVLVSKVGEQFNKQVVEKDIENIRNLYNEKGYVAIINEVNNDNGAVKYNVVEAKIEGISYEGNKKTKDWVLDKILNKRLKKGEFLTPKALQLAYKDLASTGFFKEIHIDADEGTTKGNVVLKVRVTEDQSGEWNLGGGYSDTYKAEILGGIRDKNIGGTAKSVSFDFGFGKERNHFSLSYVDPYWKKSDTAVYAKVYKTQKDIDSAYSKYTEKHTGGTVGFIKPVSEDKKTKMYASATIDKIEADNESGAVMQGLQDNYVTLGVVHDSRNEGEVSGTVVEGSVSASHKALGSEVNYAKFMASVKNYAQLSAKDVLASRLQLNYSPNNLPAIEQFTIGGADSVRGLDEDAQRGNKSVLASMELRHDLSKTVQGVVFVDAGKAWSEAVDNSLKVAAGLGLRINTAMGMLRLDMAKAGGDGIKYMFGIGQSF